MPTVPLLVAGLVPWLVVAAVPAAHDATPAATPVLPGAAACDVAPLAVEEAVARLFDPTGRPRAERPPTLVAPAADLRPGAAADPATAAAVEAATRRFLACVGTGDALRLLPLLTDDYAAAFGPWALLDPETARATIATPQPAPVDQRFALAAIEEVVVQDDGRLRAKVTGRQGSAPPSTTYLLFERAGDRLLVAGAVEGDASGATGGGAAGTAPADGATPVGSPAPAGSSACTVGEPSPAEFFAILATPRAAATPTPAAVASEADLPRGEPADPAAVAGVTATVRDLLACDDLRFLRLLTDDYLRASMDAALAPPDAAAATPGRVSSAEPPTLLAVRDARTLPDGRVGAVVVVDDPNVEPRRDATFFVFAEAGDRWLVDGTIEIEGVPPGTPTL